MVVAVLSIMVLMSSGRKTVAVSEGEILGPGLPGRVLPVHVPTCDV